MFDTPISDEVRSIRSKREAIEWAQARTPGARFVNAVTQDEFTIDVVVRVDENVYVVFDTT